jgi:hypothetical protein
MRARVLFLLPTSQSLRRMNGLAVFWKCGSDGKVPISSIGHRWASYSKRGFINDDYLEVDPVLYAGNTYYKLADDVMFPWRTR